MTFKNFMYKGVLMITVLALIGWLGKYLYLVDGEIDWFRLMLVYGVPVGIPYMFFIIGITIRAVWYVIAFPISCLLRKEKSRI